MHRAVVAGAAKGDFDSIMDSAVRMARLRKESFQLNPQNKFIYNKLFAEYVTLHDYFSWEENDVVKQLGIKSQLSVLTWRNYV